MVDLEKALKIALEQRGVIITCLGGEFIVLKVERAAPSTSQRETAVSKGGSGLRPREPVAAVFDQMFRGFAEIVAREAPGAELHEIVGRGLKQPVRAGPVTKWPAHDDYDVLKVVRRLAEEGRRVLFFTGDKRLARQAEALGDERIQVYYMPPSEYAGKEDLAQAMVDTVRKTLGKAGDEQAGGSGDYRMLEP